jgi:hypothetical protein
MQLRIGIHYLLRYQYREEGGSKGTILLAITGRWLLRDRESVFLIPGRVRDDLIWIFADQESLLSTVAFVNGIHGKINKRNASCFCNSFQAIPYFASSEMKSLYGSMATNAVISLSYVTFVMPLTI